MSGTLYIVATPIGNLGDITLRAIDMLRSVDIIAAEDTRRSAVLKQKFELSAKLLSFHEHSGEKRAEYLVQLLLDGKNIALVSDAGTPLFSDPGEDLVKAAREAGIQVVPVPGACAAVTALSGAGFSGRFAFFGFLDAKSGARKKELTNIARCGLPAVLYEAPHRLQKTLADIAEVLGGGAKITVARELTKLHEEFFEGTVKEAAERFAEPKGEFVLILFPKTDKTQASQDDITALLKQYMAEGMSRKEAAAAAAEKLNIPKNKAYKLSLDI